MRVKVTVRGNQVAQLEERCAKEVMEQFLERCQQADLRPVSVIPVKKGFRLIFPDGEDIGRTLMSLGTRLSNGFALPV